MQRRPVSIIVACAALVLGPALALSSDPAAECDRLAASPNDAVAGRSGVDFPDIDGAAARSACAAARAARPEDPRIAFQLGRAEQKLGAYEQARALYEEAGAGGYRLADAALAILYEDGLGVEADPARAEALYRRAAEAGIGVAFNNIGSMYEDGRGVAADRAKALDNYRRAADLGYSPAIGNLAWMLEHAPGGTVDEPHVLVATYLRAAAAGVDFAHTRLGHFYRDGRYVAAADIDAALTHYQRGMDLGDPWAGLYRAQILLANSRGHPDDERAGAAALAAVIAEADGELKAEALSLRAEHLLRHGGSTEEALAALMEARRVAPDAAAPHAAHALLLERLGDLEGADEKLAAALEIESDYAPWYARRADLRERLGDPATAAELRTQASTARFGAFFLESSP